MIYLLTCNKGEMHYVRQTIDQFRSRWNEYKSDSRKHHQGAACMQQHLFNDFYTSGIWGFLEDVSYKLTYPVRIKGKTTGEARLQLWHHLGLILEKVPRNFYYQYFEHLYFYKTGTFWGKKFYDISLISVVFFLWMFFIYCYFYYYL